MKQLLSQLNKHINHVQDIQCIHFFFLSISLNFHMLGNGINNCFRGGLYSAFYTRYNFTVDIMVVKVRLLAIPQF